MVRLLATGRGRNWSGVEQDNQAWEDDRRKENGQLKNGFDIPLMTALIASQKKRERRPPESSLFDPVRTETRGAVLMTLNECWYFPYSQEGIVTGRENARLRRSSPDSRREPGRMSLRDLQKRPRPV